MVHHSRATNVQKSMGRTLSSQLSPDNCHVAGSHNLIRGSSLSFTCPWPKTRKVGHRVEKSALRWSSERSAEDRRMANFGIVIIDEFLYARDQRATVEIIGDVI